jgi:hypothetical protein
MMHVGVDLSNVVKVAMRHSTLFLGLALTI